MIQLAPNGRPQAPPALPIRRMILDARVLVDLLLLMNAPKRHRCQGLPADAKVVGVATAIDLPYAVVVMLTSSTWPSIPPGSEVPLLNVEILPWEDDDAPHQG